MATFYVSPSGNDAFSGTSATASGSSGPFATLARAQQAMRGASGADTTYLLPGTHRLAAPLTLTSADSNSSYVAMAGATPVVTASTAVSGWTVGGDGIWRAQVAASSVTQVTVGGVAQTEARYPNLDPGQPATSGWLWAKALPAGRNAELEMAYDKAAVPASVLVPGAKVVAFTQDGYENDLLTIASVDTAAGIVRFSQPANDEIGPGSRFYVAGRAVHLDQPGEWWFDSASKTLSYRPPAGFNGANAVASGGNQSLFTLDGATNVTIKGLTFADHASNAAMNEDVAAVISIVDSSGNTIEGNHFTNVARGVLLDGGAHHNTIAKNSFANLMANAVEMSQGSHENVVTGNDIQDIGTLYRAGGAIVMWESWGNLVSKNHIENVPRFGIAEFNFSSASKSGGNTIEYNTVLRSGQQTNDVGAIYVFSGGDTAALGDVIRYNRIVDTGGLGTIASGGFGNRLSWGVYLDNDTNGAKVYGNFVSGTSHGGVMVHGGINNEVYNNVLLDNAVFGILLNEDGRVMTGTKVHHNLVEIPKDAQSSIVFLDTTSVSPSSVYANVYLSPTGAAPVVAERSLSQWRAIGGDAGTVVTTNAGFVNPAAGNYAFRPDSIALSSGMVQLPWSVMATDTALPPGGGGGGTGINTPTIALAPTTVMAKEGTGGTTSIPFTLTRAGDTSTAQSVSYAVSGVAGGGTLPAQAGDFVGGAFPAGTVTFAVGATTASLSVPVHTDAAGEFNERFAVTLSNPTGGATLGNATAQGMILDDDVSFSIRASSAAKPEGTGGTSPFTFVITREGVMPGTSSVSWAVSGLVGSGTLPANAADFAGGIFPSGVVSFATGETSKMVTVNVAADAVTEYNERFVVALSAPSAGSAIRIATAQGIIYDDDSIRSTAASETLIGTAGADVFILGGGNDTVTGGAGSDAFSFHQAAIGPASTSTTTITDFAPSAGERIDLSAIDAIAGTLANDAFTFIGTAAFNGTRGQLRWFDQGDYRVIQGNVNTDTTADLTIRVQQAAGPVESSWFIL